MNSVTACVVIIVGITILLLYIYYVQENNHRYQLAKIRALEYKYEKKNRELDSLRSRTQSCPVPNLNNPRACYFGSNYSCSWNDLIGRCDAIGNV